jgi:hypothetical protein
MIVVLLSVAALLLTVAPTPATALDCRGVMPLPPDVHLVTPSADVPEAIARFAGAWTGAWRDRRDNRFGEGRYHLSFWSVPYRTKTGCSLHIPYMAGLGGNLVALLPNGVSVFRFSDGNRYDLDAMILAGESIRPLCQSSASSVAPSPPPVPLTASELAIAVPEHMFTVGRQRLFFASGGRLYGALAPDNFDLGRGP